MHRRHWCFSRNSDCSTYDFQICLSQSKCLNNNGDEKNFSADCGRYFMITLTKIKEKSPYCNFTNEDTQRQRR